MHITWVKTWTIGAQITLQFTETLNTTVLLEYVVTVSDK